jgi:hypothetical protein
VNALLRSPTLRTVAVYGAAGAGFGAANLILARVLPPAEYAVITLVTALVNIGSYVAPAGLDGVVNRIHLEAGPRLLTRVLAASAAGGALFAAIGALVYGTPVSIALMTACAVTGGGALTVAAAQFQSEHRFAPSLALLQSTNAVMLLAALATVATGARDAGLAILIVTVGTVAAAVWGWVALFGERHAKPYRSADVPWREALAFLGLQLAGLLLIQLERLMLPHLLPVEALATYGVLAAVAGSLFRVLQMGVGYSLLPRLRRAADLRERRRLVAGEGRTVAAVVAAGSLAIAVLVPVVERWFLAGKYDLTTPLVIAAVLSGVAKIANAFAKASATALATPGELSAANAAGGAAVAVAVAGAVVGARWGLVGVIYGVSLGWTLRAVTFTVIAARHLRRPTLVAAQPVQAP